MIEHENLTTVSSRQVATLPGDPDGLAGSAASLKKVADSISRVTGTLQRVHDGDECESQQVDKLKETAGKAASSLRKAHEIYENTGKAIHVYQQALNRAVKNSRSIHDEAVTLLPKVNAAVDAANKADAAKQSADSQADLHPDAGSDSLQKQQTASHNAESAALRLASLRHQLDDVKQRFDKEALDLDNAAEVAKRDIKSAINHNDAKDSFWDNISSILKVAKDLLVIAGFIVALCVILIGGPIFMAIAAAISVAILLADAGLMKSGRAGWEDIAWDSLAFVPFGKLAKLGKIAGKGASSAMKSGAKAEEAASGARAVEGAATKAAERTGSTRWDPSMEPSGLARHTGASRVKGGAADTSFPQAGKAAVKDAWSKFSPVAAYRSEARAIKDERAFYRNAHELTSGAEKGSKPSAFQMVKNVMGQETASLRTGRGVSEIQQSSINRYAAAKYTADYAPSTRNLVANTMDISFKGYNAHVAGAHLKDDWSTMLHRSKTGSSDFTPGNRH